MVVSDLIKQLERAKEINGDVEVMMQATTLQSDGDRVFESTVETLRFETHKNGRVLKLYWQI